MMSNKLIRIRTFLEEEFSEEERALIWAALNAYDVGPEEANPKLYRELESRRKHLKEVFE